MRRNDVHMILAVTETRLNANVKNPEILYTNYNLLRREIIAMASKVEKCS